ncbi:hypothetical protein NECID01_1702 [Nematocida sp. AWRm77]|nr:hypothetical protein NECID01_1702 [Nematocida sp. AWRm77]
MQDQERAHAEHKQTVMHIDSLDEEEALQKYQIHYYTVKDLVRGGDIGTKIQKLYKDNYL